MRSAEFNGLLAGLVEFKAQWDPCANASRGEVAQILHHLLALMPSASTTTSTSQSSTTSTSSTTTTSLPATPAATFAVTMTGGMTLLSAAEKTAGTPFSVRVTAEDAGGITVTGYTGTVALTSNAFVGTVNAVITTGGLVDGIVLTPTIAGANRMIYPWDGTATPGEASSPFTETAYPYC